MKKIPLSLKDLIYNQLMTHGNKLTNEKILLTNFKFLQKENTKNYIHLIKLAVINSAPIIRTRKLKKKNRKSVKEFPYVLTKKNRISSAVQNIRIKSDKKQLFNKIIFFAQKRSDILKEKFFEQQLSLAKKKYLFFRWFF